MPSHRGTAKRKSANQRRTPSPGKPGTANHLFDFVHALEAIVWEADAGTLKFTFVSKQAERILGYPARRWLEEADFWVNHIHPEDREQTVAYCQEATKRGKDHSFEYRFLAADGRTVWLRDLVRVVKDRGGHAQRLYGVMVDITERKREEEQLRRHLHSLQALYRVASSLNESFEAEAVIQKAIQEITAIFRFEATRVFLYSPAKDELRLVASYEADSNLRARLTVFPKGQGILGRVCDTGEPMVFEDVYTDPRYRELSLSNAADNAKLSFFAVYPIRSKNETLGAAVFLGKVPRRLESYEDILIRSITEQIGVALENAELVRSLESSLDRARALHDVSLALNSNVELKVVLNVLLEQADRVIPHTAAEIRLLNQETGVLEPTACRNLDVNEWKAVRAGRGLAKIVLESQAPLAIRDVQHDPRTSNPEFMKRESILSFLGVPLTVMGNVIGCFIVLTREHHEFVDEEIELFSALASQAALTIHKARLYEQVKEQAVELTAANVELKRHTLEQGVVAHLGDLALGGCDLQSLMDEAVMLVAQALEVEYAKVLELLPDGNALVLRAGVGWKEGLVGQATVDAKENSQAGYTLASYEPVVVEDLSTETRFRAPAVLREHGVTSGVSVVIYGKTGPHGVLGAHSTKRRTFTREQVAFVQAVANLLATAIERRRAEGELRNSRAELRALADRLATSKEEEAKRLARELHDETGQILAAVYLALDEFSKSASPRQNDGLEKIRSMLDRIDEQLRAIVQGLRPTVLDDLGLMPALRSLTQSVAALSGIGISLEGSVPTRLPALVETALYRIVQEALNNVVKHSQAREVKIQIRQENGRVRCFVHDDGVGFDIRRILARPGRESLGLVGMRERVAALGGELTIDSADRRGTELRVTIPAET